MKHTGDARGMGLYATKNICEDNNIIECMGELITMAEKKKRHNSLKLLSTFQAKYTDELAIDADLYGNESRYANHSCSPNSNLKPWWVDSQVTVEITHQPKRAQRRAREKIFTFLLMRKALEKGFFLYE